MKTEANDPGWDPSNAGIPSGKSVGARGPGMNICVLGLWHLGLVTAACLSEAGHKVVGIEFDEETVGGLQQGVPPIFEPGLEELIRRGLSGGQLSFPTDLLDAVSRATVVCVTC